MQGSDTNMHDDEYKDDRSHYYLVVLMTRMMLTKITEYNDDMMMMMMMIMMIMMTTVSQLNIFTHILRYAVSNNVIKMGLTTRQKQVTLPFHKVESAKRTLPSRSVSSSLDSSTVLQSILLRPSGEDRRLKLFTFIVC